MFSPSSIEGLITLEGTAADEAWSAMAAAPTLTRTVAAASTLALDADDPDGDLTPLLPGLTATLADGTRWHLAAVRRGESGRTRLVFEDDVVTRLRSAMHQVSVPAGSTTLGELLARLATVAGVEYTVDPNRRTLAAATALAGPVWRSIGTLATGHDQWRFSTGTRLVVASPEWLLAASDTTDLDQDDSRVGRIGFTVDVGRDLDTAAAEVTDWAPAPGDVTTLTGLGPASGRWLVSSHTTNLGDDVGRVTWTRPAGGATWS